MNRTVPICAVLVSLGLLTLTGAFWTLHGRQKEYVARLAQEREEAAQKQAADLLKSAESALEHFDATEAQNLLTAYLAHEHATEKDRAERLAAGLRRATNRDKAAALARRLSDDQMERLATGESPPLPEGRTIDPLVRPIFYDTLRGQVLNERRRRAAKAEAEQAEAQRRKRELTAREARVRESAPYKEMAEFAGSLRKRYRDELAMRAKQKLALARLSSELKIDVEEQARLRKEPDGDKTEATLKKAFAARRGSARKAFAALEGITAADVAVFDQVLNRLAETVLAGGE